MIVSTIPSKTYVMTSTSTCTVTAPLPTGGDVLLASLGQEGGQCSFTAVGNSVEVSDDAAVVLPFTTGRSLASFFGNAVAGGSATHVIRDVVLPERVILRDGDEVIFVPAVTSMDLGSAFNVSAEALTVSFVIVNTLTETLSVYEGEKLLAELDSLSQLRGTLVCTDGNYCIVIDGAAQNASAAAASASEAAAAQTAADASASAAAISAAEAAASAALAMDGVVEQDAMMTLARHICASKTPYPEEFLMASETTTAAEWQSLAAKSYSACGDTVDVYVEYHPHSDGGRYIDSNDQNMVSKYYYLVTKESGLNTTSSVYKRGQYNFIWTSGTNEYALCLGSFDYEKSRFWFIYAPEITLSNTNYRGSFGSWANVIMILPKLTGVGGNMSLIKTDVSETGTNVTSNSMKNFIVAVIPSIRQSIKVAYRHRCLASGIVLTLNSLADVTDLSSPPTLYTGIDPDAISSISEDGSMTFADAKLKTAVDAAVAKGWTVAFNVIPLPEISSASAASLEASAASPAAALSVMNALSTMNVGETTSQDTNGAAAATPTEAAAESVSAATQLWYHAEPSDYGDYTDADGQRVAITSAKGFAGAAEDGSWQRGGSESEVAAIWGLTYAPQETAELEPEAEASVSTTESSTDNNNHE